MRSIMEGVRVIDFTANVSGPATTVFLADMGAEVIKVEKPGGGDDARLFPPYVEGFSASFVIINRGKKSITLNLKTHEGKEIFRDLIAESDVLVENHKPGTMEKLGFSYDYLSEINPGLIMLSLSGYGQYGPLSGKPAYDSIIQAMSGIMSITGFPDGPPTKSGPILIDITTAIQSAFAISAALYAREKTGEGEYLDVSMFEVGINLLSGTWTEYTVNGNNQERTGNRYPYVSPFDTYLAKDGYFMVCSANDPTFHKICDAMERSDLKSDEKFENLFVRNENQIELSRIVSDWVASHTIKELTEKADRFGFPGAPVFEVSDVVNHPHTIERGIPVNVEQPGRGTFNVYGPPVKAKNSEIKVRGPAPELGEHNDWVLENILKKSSGEIDEIISSGAMG